MEITTTSNNQIIFQNSHRLFYILTHLYKNAKPLYNILYEKDFVSFIGFSTGHLSNNPNKDFYVKLNSKDDIIELYDSSSDRLIETISGNELQELVKKLIESLA